MRFTVKSSWRSHIYSIHLKRKRFECRFCGKKFAEKTGLRSHSASIHNDAVSARFECNICHKRWYEKGSYLKHIKNGHIPKDPIKEMIKRGECIYSDCDKKYNGKKCAESVKYHLATFHKDRRYANYECKQCNQLYYDKTA